MAMGNAEDEVRRRRYRTSRFQLARLRVIPGRYKREIEGPSDESSTEMMSPLLGRSESEGGGWWRRRRYRTSWISLLDRR